MGILAIDFLIHANRFLSMCSLVEGRLEFLAAEYEEGGHVDEHAAHRQRDDEGAEQPLGHPITCCRSQELCIHPVCFIRNTVRAYEFFDENRKKTYEK